MEARITALLICGFSMYTLYLSVPALTGSAEFAAFLSDLSDYSKAPPLDQANWLMHWRLACTFVIVCAGLGVIAGIGIFFRRRWSWLLLAGIALSCSIVNIGINIVGYSRYAFESFQWLPNLAFIVVALAALHTYRKHDHLSSGAASA